MKVMKKMHLQAVLLDPDQAYDDRLDVGFRSFLGMKIDYERVIREKGLWTQENKIFRLQDEFSCVYMFMILPGVSVPRALLVGPYITFEIGEKEILEIAEELRIPACNQWRFLI